MEKYFALCSVNYQGVVLLKNHIFDIQKIHDR